MKKHLGPFLVLTLSLTSSAQAFWPFDKPAEKPEAVASQPAEPAALTLQEAYRLALKQSETVAMKVQELNIAQGHFYQSLDVVMPKVSFQMTRSEQDPQEATFGESGVGGSILRPTTNTRRFVFSQPIFSGFKEIAALQGSGAERSQKRNEIRRAKEMLFIDVMEAYYNLQQARKDINILESTRAALEQRVGELEERVKLGRSRENEMQTSVAGLKLTEALLLQAKRFEIISRQLLEFYIGRPIPDKLADEQVPASEPSGREEDYILKADQRSDVRAVADSYYLKQQQVIAAQAGLFPSVTLDGSYYTQREGFQSGVTWDTLLTIDVPIFDGTETFGNIKVAASEKDREKYLYLQTKRMARLDISSAYQEYVSSKAETEAYREAVEAFKKDYDMQTEDYRLNLVSNLDVLDSLRRYEETRRTYNDSDYNARRNFWKLRAAVGDISIVNEEEAKKK